MLPGYDLIAVHWGADRRLEQPRARVRSCIAKGATDLYREHGVCHMPRTVARKEHPLSMRLPETDIAIIDRAAALRGRSRTDFVRDAAVRAAEDVLMETIPIRMSPAGFKAFMAALSGPATPVPEMTELFWRSAPWEKSGSKARD
jgi:uncharacterized protein (DUF1778 family)